MPASGRSFSSAGELLAAVVADHVRRVEQRVPAALVDEPDAVHRLRTAVRRLRNVLAVNKRLFDDEALTDLRRRLAELGDVLGPARDLEVRSADAAGLTADLGIADALDERLLAGLRAEHAAAHAAFVRWCTGEDMAGTTAELVRWAAGPPLADGAHEPARRTARRALRRQCRRTLEAADGLDLRRLGSPAAPGFDAELERAHDLRKAARRLSHAAGAVTKKPTAVLGGRAKDLRRAGSRVQDALGSHRDALMLAAHARRVGDDVGRDGRPREPFDAVAREAERRALAALADVPAAVARLREACERFG